MDGIRVIVDSNVLAIRQISNCIVKAIMECFAHEIGGFSASEPGGNVRKCIYVNVDPKASTNNFPDYIVYAQDDLATMSTLLMGQKAIHDMVSDPDPSEEPKVFARISWIETARHGGKIFVWIFCEPLGNKILAGLKVLEATITLLGVKAETVIDNNMITISPFYVDGQLRAIRERDAAEI